MARLPRIVIPGLPHHVTPRGNQRSQTFFHDYDYALYKYLLSEAAEKEGSEIWCYCLMPTTESNGEQTRYMRSLAKFFKT
jgi:putative transposase